MRINEGLKLLRFSTVLRDMRLIVREGGDIVLIDSCDSPINEHADDADNGYTHHE
jgi:hypothetical protein